MTFVDGDHGSGTGLMHDQAQDPVLPATNQRYEAVTLTSWATLSAALLDGGVFRTPCAAGGIILRSS